MSNQYLQLLKEKGVHFDGVKAVMSFDAALKDASPALQQTPNNGIPWYNANYVDPDVARGLFAPLAATDLIGAEQRKGDRTTTSAEFPYIIRTGGVAAYDDFVSNGRSGANLNFEYRQSFLYQTMIEYGELEEDRIGLVKIAWATQLMMSAVENLNYFQNLTYLYGVAGLQNYGITNDPALSAPITPAPKAAGGNSWFNGTTPVATPNEVYNDVISVFQTLVNQAGGQVTINSNTAMRLGLSPNRLTALTFANNFMVSTEMLLKKNFPNIEFVPVPQFAAYSASNPQGNPGGELMMLISSTVGGQDVAFPAFNEKLRTSRIVLDTTSMKQKASQGTFGTVIKFPLGIAQMVGI